VSSRSEAAPGRADLSATRAGPGNPAGNLADLVKSALIAKSWTFARLSIQHRREDPRRVRLSADERPNLRRGWILLPTVGRRAGSRRVNECHPTNRIEGRPCSSRRADARSIHIVSSTSFSGPYPVATLLRASLGPECCGLPSVSVAS
jgi:hypothetical protein